MDKKMESPSMDCDDSSDFTDITSDGEEETGIEETVTDFQILLQVDKSFSSMSMNDEVRLVRIDLKKLDTTTKAASDGEAGEAPKGLGPTSGVFSSGDCSRDSKARFEFGKCQIETLKALFEGRATLDELKFFSDEEDDDDMECGEGAVKPIFWTAKEDKVEDISNGEEDQQPCSSQQAKERDSKRQAGLEGAPENPGMAMMAERVASLEESEGRLLANFKSLLVTHLMEQIKKTGLSNNYSHAEWNIYIGTLITEILERCEKDKKNGVKLDTAKVLQVEQHLFKAKKEERKWEEDENFMRGYAKMVRERRVMIDQIKAHLNSGCRCGAIVCKKPMKKKVAMKKR